MFKGREGLLSLLVCGWLMCVSTVDSDDDFVCVAASGGSSMCAIASGGTLRFVFAEEFDANSEDKGSDD